MLRAPSTYVSPSFRRGSEASYPPPQPELVDVTDAKTLSSIEDNVAPPLESPEGRSRKSGVYLVALDQTCLLAVADPLNRFRQKLSRSNSE